MLFIVNPISGTGKKDAVIRLLQKRGYPIVCTEYAGHAEHLAREATDAVVVAVGGDGTVNEVARGLLGTEKILGILPCGSGDGLARCLGLSHLPQQALVCLEQGYTQWIDVAWLDERPFFSVCGLGFDAQVSERFAEHGQRGVLNYIRQGLKTWKEYSPRRYELEIDGVTYHHEALFVTIGNSNQWGNGALIAPLADLQDGLLDVVVVEDFSGLELPHMAYQLMRGSLDTNAKVHYYKGRAIRIRRDEEGPVHTDGDWFWAGKDVAVKISPQALRVIIPQ